MYDLERVLAVVAGALHFLAARVQLIAEGRSSHDLSSVASELSELARAMEGT